MQGEVKNIVDALRRTLQGPASVLAAGVNQIGGSFTITATPSSIQAPGGVANAYQSSLDIASVSSFNGLVTLTASSALSQVGGSVGLPTSTVQVTPPSPQGDGVVVININVGVTTPAGVYGVQVTGTSSSNGVTITATCNIQVTVGSGTGPCVNNNDCGTGNVCSNGQCYTPTDGTILHKGPCVARDTATCKSETNTQACNGLDGNCRCANTQAQCQALNCSAEGPCSSGSLLSDNCSCGCSDCKGGATPITVSCPSAEIDYYNIGAGVSPSGTFTVTNTNPASGYNINMSIVPVGQNCSCCGGGPSLSTGGGYSIGPGGVQGTTITLPSTCTTTGQCWTYNLKIQVQLAISQATIQSLMCPVSFCLKPCKTLKAGAGIAFSGAPTNCCPADCTNGQPGWSGSYSISDQHGNSGNAAFDMQSGSGTISGVTMVAGDAITVSVCTYGSCWPRNYDKVGKFCFAGACGTGTECELIATVTSNIGNSAGFSLCGNCVCGSCSTTGPATGKWCPSG